MLSFTTLPGCTRFSHLFCEECKVHLCITSKRNCFYKYHHSSQPQENNTAHQAKLAKNSHQTIESTKANDLRSSRRRTSGVVKKQDKNTLKRTATNIGAKKKSSCRHNTRSQVRAVAAKELITAESSQSQKESFMEQIGLGAKKMSMQ